MTKKQRNLALFAGASANFILGFNFIIEKLIEGVKGLEASPLVILAYECTICVIVMTLFIPLAKPDFKKIKGMGIKKLLPVLGMAICDPLLYYIGATYATKFGASPLYITVMVATMPIFAMVLGIFVLREIPTLLQTVFSVVSVAAVIGYTVIASSYSSEEAGVISPTIILFLLITVASGVGYGMFTRKSSADLTSFERTYICFFCAAIIIDVLAIATNAGNIGAVIEPAKNMEFMILVLIFGTFSLTLEYTAYNYSMNYLQASQAMIFSGLSTVVTFIFTYVLFEGERVATVQKIICIVFILIGVVGAEMFGRKEEPLNKKE